MSSHLLPERRTRMLLLVLAVSLLTSACGGAREFLLLEPEPDRVSIKGYSLDLAYGEEPPPADTGGGPRPSAPMTLTELAEEVFELPPPRPRRIQGTTPPDPCPSPGPGIVADRAITPDVEVLIDPGVYLFQQTGTFEIVGVAKTSLEGLTSRVVRNLSGDIETFDFELELAAGSRRQVQAYRVVPGDGIFLTGLVVGVGEDRYEFNPVVPVEVFPLPAVENAPLSSAGIDPITGQSMVVQGRIVEKQRVLGCDEVVDGWRFEGTWSFQRPAGGSLEARVFEYDYVVAPQHGGMIVSDHLVTTENYGPLTARTDVNSDIGSVTPRPEPANQQRRGR